MPVSIAFAEPIAVRMDAGLPSDGRIAEPRRPSAAAARRPFVSTCGRDLVGLVLRLAD